MARRGDRRARRLRRPGLARSPSLRARAHPRHALRGAHGRPPRSSSPARRRDARAALRRASGPHLAELAHHAIAAGDHDKGLRYARHAADRALEQLAYEEAARLFRLALEALAAQPPVDPAARSDLLLAPGDALAKAGSTADAKEMFLAACDLARTACLPETFARAALGYGGTTGWQRAGDDTRLVPLLEEALAALGENGADARARLLARLAGALRDEPSLEPRSSLSREAVEIARRLGDKETLAYALTSLFMATWGPDVGELVRDRRGGGPAGRRDRLGRRHRSMRSR